MSEYNALLTNQLSSADIFNLKLAQNTLENIGGSLDDILEFAHQSTPLTEAFVDKLIIHGCEQRGAWVGKNLFEYVIQAQVLTEDGEYELIKFSVWLGRETPMNNVTLIMQLLTKGYTVHHKIGQFTMRPEKFNFGWVTGELFGKHSASKANAFDAEMELISELSADDNKFVATQRYIRALRVIKKIRSTRGDFSVTTLYQNI